MIQSDSKTSVIMTFLTIIGLIGSVLVQITIAYLFGAGWQTDAYLVACMIPLFIAALFGEPFGLAMLPIMNEIKATRGNEAARRFAMVLLVSLVLVVTALTTFMLFGADWLVRASAPGFSAKQAELAVWMFRVFALSAGFSIMAALMQYLYYYNKTIIWPYSFTLIPPMVMIGCAFLLAKVVGIKSIALGALAASGLQCAALGPVLRKYRGVTPTFIQDILRAYKNAATIAFSMVPIWVTPLMDRYLASWMPDGSISYLGYSWTFAVAAASLLSRGTLVALFPKLSEQASTNLNDFQRLAQRLTESLLFLAVSAVVVGEFLIDPAVRLLLIRGQFTIQDARNVIAVLRWHLISIAGIVLINTANRVNYARRFANLSAFMSLFHIMLYFAMAVVLARYFGLIGVAVANAISWSLSAVVIVSLLVWKRVFKDSRGFIRSVLRVSLAAACLFLALSMGAAFLKDNNVLLLFAAAGGGMSYLLLSLRFLAQKGVWVKPCLKQSRIRLSIDALWGKQGLK